MAQCLSSLTYISTPRDGFDANDLKHLWITCLEANTEYAITGGMVFLGNQFFQTIEGAEPDVRALWDRIRADPRHHDLEVIMECDPPSRSFRNAPMKVINGTEVPWMHRRFGRAGLRGASLQELSRTIFRLARI